MREMHENHDILDTIFKGLTSVLMMGGAWLVNTTSKNKNKLDVMEEKIKGEEEGRKSDIKHLTAQTDIQFQSIKESLERIELNTKRD